MPADSVKRSAGITVSAIVAILGSIASLLLGMLMILTDVMRPSSSLPDQPASPIPPGVVVAIMATFYCGFGLWGIASASGLLRLKNWARLCFVIFGGLLAFFSLCTAAGTAIAAFVLPATPLPENVPQGLVTGVFVFVAASSLVCLAIAIWWLVYFNRATVIATFAAEAAGGASRPRQFPVAVSIIAWVLIAGSAMTAIQMLFSYPLLIFGIVFRGLVASLLLAIFAAVGIAAGIGMLKRRAEAHSLAVGYCVFGILNVASIIVLPGSFARMQDVIRETQGSQALALPADAMYSFMVLGMLIGLVATSGMLWLLIRWRKPFVDACRLPVE
jgi:hypothetical protein